MNSNPDTGGGMVGSYQPLIEKTLKHAYGKKTAGIVTCTPTAHQMDKWSCGYHVLAGIATDANITHFLQTDQRKDYKKRTDALRNWAVKLILSKTFDEHNQAIKRHTTVKLSPLSQEAITALNLSDLEDNSQKQLNRITNQLLSTIKTLLPNGRLHTLLTDEIKEKKTQRQGILSRLIFPAITIDKNKKRISLKTYAVRLLEDAALREEIALEVKDDNNGINSCHKHKQATLFNPPLTGEDLTLGVYALMLENPKQRASLINTHVCSSLSELQPSH